MARKAAPTSTPSAAEEAPAPKPQPQPVAPPAPLIENVAAPFLYFDRCPNFGYNEGICNVTLEATRFSAVGQVVASERVQVAHLRMSRTAALRLKDAIDKVLLMGQPVSGSAD